MLPTNTPDPRRLGVLVPATDMVVEVDFRNHLPPSVVFYTARLHQSVDSAIGTKNFQGLVDSAPEAARSVALAKPELLAFCCTSASFFKGPDWHWQLSEMIADATGIPTITTSTAVLAALKALDARNVFMASPYPDVVNEAEMKWLKTYGIDVTAVLNFGCTKSQEVFNVSPRTIVDQVLARRSEVESCEVLFLTCTGLRSFDVAQTLEVALGVPVITSNLATMWFALAKLGQEVGDQKSGRLFRCRAPSDELLKAAHETEAGQRIEEVSNRSQENGHNLTLT